MLKRITLAARAPVYHHTLQVIVALKAGVADRVYDWTKVIALEGWKIWKTDSAEQKAPSLFGRWAEQEGAWRETVLTLCS